MGWDGVRRDEVRQWWHGMGLMTLAPLPHLDGQLSLAVVDRVASDACVEWLDTIRPESRVISAAHAEVIAEHVAHSCQQPHVACRAPAITDVAVDVVVCLKRVGWDGDGDGGLRNVRPGEWGSGGLGWAGIGWDGIRIGMGQAG